MNINEKRMKIKLRDTTDTIKVSKEVFDIDFKPALIHQVITSYIHNSRQGTKAQKNYKTIRGGGKKPWKQKGTGRARAGSIRSPLWRGGCITFAVTHKTVYKKINRKMYKLAMCAIISELLRQKRLIVLNEIKLNVINTNFIKSKMEELNINFSKTLIITETCENKIELSSRNISNVESIKVGSVNPIILINTNKVLITLAALRKLEEKFKI
ncbi:LSU ribosomal protein L4p (L1e) [Candidatus Portiera aleyrodidarum BT-B-HRs]|uniref:50S ribosomal protein L4 n=2 Tax=Candidatus Portiera aleyrodidarum TaxID=91844 RepID=UPI000286D521|nr:50S ribosomal protein L4 [Candidatus Portiera aleyrodidarum]AFT80717.1 LSU ribosomal protein L4p (L1e) [Candidatus Portiera aleyrodidarum BT-B-HRs]